MHNTALLVAGCLLFLATDIRAQGFGIYEQGACAMARGGAAVAEPCQDGSAIYINPAGAAGTRGLLVGLGGTLIAGNGWFRADRGAKTSLDSPLSGVPHGYLLYGLNNRLVLGVGVYVPYGLGVRWPVGFSGRFVAYDSHLDTTYIQPTVAYAVTDRLSVGGGLAVGIGSVKLKRHEDLATVPLGIVPGLTFGSLVDPETDFVTTVLSASRATGAGFNVGVMAKVNESVRVGAKYLSKMTLSYDGTASFTAIPGNYSVTKANPLGLPVGAPLNAFVAQVTSNLPQQGVSTSIDMPAQFTAGVSLHVHRRVTLFDDYQWVGWSSFKKVAIKFSNPIPPDEELIQNYRNTNALRTGVVVETRPSIRLNAGYFHNQAAAPAESVTPLLPEAARNHVTAGVSWTLRPAFSLDIAYQFVRHADRRGRVVNPPPGVLPTIALNSGLYHERANLLGATVTYRH